MPALVKITDSPAGDDVSVERDVLVGIRVEKAKWHDVDSLAAAVRNADAIMCMHAPLNQVVLRSLSSCKVIARFGTGLDNIDCDAARSLKIPVVAIDNYCTQEVANHTMALLLAWNRKILEYDRFIREGRWAERTETTGNWGCGALTRLSGQVLGLVGFGRIARAVARRAIACEMRVVVHSRSIRLTDPPGSEVQFVDLRTLLRLSDYVSLHIPLTEATRHLINHEAISYMKPTAILINTARGAVVQENALLEALTTGRIAGALLDVYGHAPLSADHPLRSLHNVILTPHVGFYSEEAMLELRRRAAEGVLLHLNGT